MVLDVLCGESELAEYSRVVTVGESIRRMGVRRREVWFGTGLDEVEYQFDGYTEVVGDLPPLAIAGEVHAIAAIYVRLVTVAGALLPERGSVLLEPLQTTARTRQPPRPSTAGGVPGWAPVTHRDGTEVLWGWRFTLTDFDVTAW